MSDAGTLEHLTNTDQLRNEILKLESELLDISKLLDPRKVSKDMRIITVKANQALRTLEQKADFSNQIEFEVSKCWEDCEQSVPFEKLCKPKGYADASDFILIRKVVEGLQSCPVALPANRELIIQTLGKSIKTFNSAEKEILNSSLQSSIYTQWLEEMLGLIQEVMAIQSINESESLIEIEERMRRTRFDVEVLQEQQQEFLMQGQMNEAELLYHEITELQENVVNGHQESFTTLDHFRSRVVDRMLQAIQDCYETTVYRFRQISEEANNLKSQCHLDLEKLKEATNRLSNEHNQYMNSYHQEMDRSDSKMKELYKQEEELWFSMQQIYEEIGSIAKQRYDEIVNRLNNFEAAEVHKVSYSNFLDFTKKHKDSLQWTIKNCETQEHLSQIMGTFIFDRCQDLEHCMENHILEVENLRTNIQLQRMDDLKRLYVTNGDLMHKKQLLLDEVEEKVKTSEALFQICMDSLDPKAKIYASEKKELMKIVEHLKSQIDNLENTQQLYLEWVKPTEQHLLSCGVKFIHPIDELEHLNEVRYNKVNEYKALLSKPVDPSDIESLDIENKIRNSNNVLLIEDDTKEIRPTPPSSTKSNSRPHLGYN